MFYERTPLSYLIYAILVMSCIIIGLNKVEMCNMKTELKMQVFPCFFINALLTQILRFYRTFLLSWNMFRLCLVKKRTSAVFSLAL